MYYRQYPIFCVNEKKIKDSVTKIWVVPAVMNGYVPYNTMNLYKVTHEPSPPDYLTILNKSFYMISRTMLYFHIYFSNIFTNYSQCKNLYPP